MTQTITFKAGQAHAIYDATPGTAAQLRDEKYRIQSAGGGGVSINFDTKNSPIFSKRVVREAIEYAIDKEAISQGPGQENFLSAFRKQSLLPSASNRFFVSPS